MAKKKKSKGEVHLAAESAAQAAVAQDVAARYGAAVNEYLAGYDGVNYGAGFTPHAPMQKSLKSISESRVNSKFEDRNLKQQAGFAAEVIETADQRANAAAQGKRPSVLRMDDVGPKGERHSNNQFIDITSVDVDGNPILKSGYQMKFVGKDPKECCRKLLGKKCRKYLDKGVGISVPSDYFDEVRTHLETETLKVQKQIDALKRAGKPIPESKLQRLKYCRKLERSLRKACVSKADAEEARLHPKVFTAEKIGKQALLAGVENAKLSAQVAGTLSGVYNLLALARGEKTVKEVFLDISRDALVAGAGGFFTSVGGSAISGALMHSSNRVVRAMGASGFPGVAISYVISSAATLGRYFNGEIRGSECVDELAGLGLSMSVGSVASSGISATIQGTQLAAIGVGGVAVLPVAGAIVASMVASAIFTGLKNWAYKDAYAAEARAREVEQRCAEACRQLEVYRIEINRYLSQSNAEFCRFMAESLFMIDNSDFKTSVGGANRIVTACGGHALVQDVNDVDGLMRAPFKIGK